MTCYVSTAESLWSVLWIFITHASWTEVPFQLHT